MPVMVHTPTTSIATAVIVAAGRSERMGGIDKVFAQLMGRPLLAWTLAAFKRCDEVDEIIIVTAAESLANMQRFVAEWRFTKVTQIVAGGDTRQASVRAGIDAAPDAAIIVVHDAARPLVTPELIASGIALARETGAALCAIPARDTVKEVAGEPPVVSGTLDRERMWLAQTPQVFARALLLEAHQRATAIATDDAALIEALGHHVRVYEGAPSNFKVTTPEDLIIAEALLRERFAT